MDEKLIKGIRRRMGLLDDVVDVRDGRADEERKEECNYKVFRSPKVHVESIENAQKRETP